MKLIFSFLCLTLIPILSPLLYAGNGMGGKTIEIRSSIGYVPFAQFRIKNRDYNFYYTGQKIDLSLTYYTAQNAHGGLYFVTMNLDNKQNSNTHEETIKIAGVGLTMIGAIPIAIRPFIEVGVGYYVAKIEATSQESHVEQIYKQGTAGKISLGLGPRIKGVGLYVKLDGEFVNWEKGEDRNNSQQKLFKAYQFSYSTNLGVQIAL